MRDRARKRRASSPPLPPLQTAPSRQRRRRALHQRRLLPQRAAPDARLSRRVELKDLNDVVGVEACSPAQFEDFVPLARADDAEICLIFDQRVGTKPAEGYPLPFEFADRAAVPRRDSRCGLAVEVRNVRLDEKGRFVFGRHTATVDRAFECRVWGSPTTRGQAMSTVPSATRRARSVRERRSSFR